MILVDTSIWIDHLRTGIPALVSELEAGNVLMHPFVLGEIACGQLRNRGELLELFAALQMVGNVTDSEALEFIEKHKLMGRGIGYVDVHLLASTVSDGVAKLWTRDKKLAVVAKELKLAYANAK